jgi:hypothetical protein
MMMNNVSTNGGPAIPFSVQQLAAQYQLGQPSTTYSLEKPRVGSMIVGSLFVLLMALFWLSVGIGGLAVIGNTVLWDLQNRHHPVLCVTTRLFKEEVLRGYYRQRLFL